MDFDAFLDDAWNRHAEDPAGVAATLQRPGLGLVRSEDDVLALAHLAQHVQGEHLGWWRAGIDMQQQLAAMPAAPRQGAGAARLQRYRRALELCAAPADASEPWAGLDPGERIGVAATAAAHLARLDTPRAQALLNQALQEAEAAGLSPGDPTARALAGGTNNLAGALEVAPVRSEAQRALMIQAAEAARRWWAVAGTWLETERADYRLAGVWLAAGDPVRARQYAQACLDRVVAEGGGAPLERFHAWDALGRAARAGGDAAALHHAREAAASAYDALPESERGACRPVLEALRSD